MLLTKLRGWPLATNNPPRPRCVSDTSEKGLEALIVGSLVDESGYRQTEPGDFDRDHAVDPTVLLEFLCATQPKIVDALGIGEEGPKRLQFLHRLQGEISKRGIVDVLRRGIKHGPSDVDLFYLNYAQTESDPHRI